jgi:hypothetical protein
MSLKKIEVCQKTFIKLALCLWVYWPHREKAGEFFTANVTKCGIQK